MATEKLNITRVTYSDKKKDGTPIVTKFGKPAFKVGIQTKEYGDVWLNGFLPFAPTKWEGTVQEVEVVDDEKWGKQFKLPPRGNSGVAVEKLIEEIRAVNTNVLRMIGMMQELAQYLKDDGKLSDGSLPPKF